MCPSSVGSSPVLPSVILTRHWAQVPPPPQAEGTKILRSARVPRRVPPARVSIGCSLSPLSVILTLPVLTSWLFASSRITTMAITTRVNMPTPRRMVSMLELSDQEQGGD
jgi:hypothetical protein